MFEKVDVKVELPTESWRGFVFTTDSVEVEYKRIATYLKDRNVWVDGHFEYHDEFVTHWLKEKI